MQCLLLLSLISGLVASTTAECSACLRSQCYSKSIVFDGGISGDLAVDRSTNDLYYQYRDAAGEYHQVSQNLDTNVAKSLSIAEYVPHVTVDQNTRDVYWGSSRGLYVHKTVTNQTLFLGLSNIDQLQFKNTLHYAETLFGLFFIQDNNVYYYTALHSVAIDDFVIDKNDDIYYRSGARIYKFQHPDSIHLFTHRFAKLAVDVNGELYYSVFTEVFKYNYESGAFDNFGLVPNSNMFRHEFDRDNNLVYYDIKGTGRVYKLSESEGMSCSVVNNKIVVTN